MEQSSLQPQLVRPQLYIASCRTEQSREVLQQNGITHVLQAGVELSPSHPQHFKYLQLPLYDMPEQDIVGSFPAAFAFIESAMAGDGGVLVHCQAGISRSATIVIAYCMWKERLSTDAATALVSAARSVIWPNSGFACQLKEFEKLGWDASRWQGWNMSRFLSTRYGDESVGFMTGMLGGAPQDRVCMRQQQQQHVSQAQQQLVQLQQQQQHYQCHSDAAAAAAAIGGAYGLSAAGEDAPCRSSTALQHHSAGGGSGTSRGQGRYSAAASLRGYISMSPASSGDQQPARRGSPKHGFKAGSSSSSHAPLAGDCSGGCQSDSPRGAHHHGSNSSNSGCVCKAAAAGVNHSVRRYSVACYCHVNAPAAAAAAGGGWSGQDDSSSSSSGGRRVRRHSTGQQEYAMAAAAAGFTTAVQLGAMSQLSASISKLPEEAALLMAG